jgi:CHASE3 domain sensor protein
MAARREWGWIERIERRLHMTISRKLYTGFGSILGILVILFVVSFVASHIEHTARATAAESLQSIQNIERIRYQVMQTGLDLRNYLLSGDPRMESAKVSDTKTLAITLREARDKTSDSQLREVYSSIESNLQSWEDDFATPLIAKRHQVDAGQTTVSDLQIIYLQRSANTLIEKSMSALDEAKGGIQKAQDKSEESATSSANYSTVVLILGTIIGAL